jgi:hypothetical protein
MKSFKNLFIKDESEKEEPQETNSFPVSSSSSPVNQVNTGSNPYLDEVVEVYEKGLERINMPGYDFYDFYLAIKAAGSQNNAVYKMAYQMGKTLDSDLSARKLSNDADYYISKLNEVHQNYSEKGKQKLNSLSAELKTDKDRLTAEIQHIEGEITRLKQQIVSMEQKLAETKNDLMKVEGKYSPEQHVINLKLRANDEAMQTAVNTLTSIKEGILKYIK